LASSHS